MICVQNTLVIKQMTSEQMLEPICDIYRPDWAVW